MPQGPAQAVLVAVAAIIQGPTGLGGGGSFISSGCPESIRDMSGSGTPLAPIFHGVWQSLQPPMVTRYWPRAMSAALDGAGWRVACACASRDVMTRTDARIGSQSRGRIPRTFERDIEASSYGSIRF